MSKTFLCKGKVITANSSDVVRNPDYLIGSLYDLKDEIKEFEDSYDYIDKFIKKHKLFIKKMKVVSKLNSDTAAIIWEITNKENKECTFALVLSKGLESYVKYIVDDGDNFDRTRARKVFMQKLYEFLK